MKRQRHITLRIGLGLALGLGGAGCAEEDYIDEAFGVMDLAPYYNKGFASLDPAEALPKRVAPVRGYAQGEMVEYYDFGVSPYDRAAPVQATFAPTNPIYFFFDEAGRPLHAQPVRSERTNVWHMPGGNPTKSPNQTADADRALPYSLRRKELIHDPRRGSSAHQRPIIDTALESPERASGLWEIVEVVVRGDYAPDSIKSFRTLERAERAQRVSLRRTGKVINCPLIDERTEVWPALASYDVPKPRIELWHRRKLGFCLLANGWETLADPRDGRLLGANSDPARLQTFDVMPRRVMENGETRDELVVPARPLYRPAHYAANVVPGSPPTVLQRYDDLISEERPRRTEADPPGYSPVRVFYDILLLVQPQAEPPKPAAAAAPAIQAMNMVSEPDADDGHSERADAGADAGAAADAGTTPGVVSVAVPPFQAGSIRAIDRMKLRTALPLGQPPSVRNVATLGVVVTCGTKDGAGACGQPETCRRLGLECDPISCLCEPPSVGFGELCGPGFRRCRRAPLGPEEERFAPLGFICHPREPRGFCLVRCAADPDIKARTLDGVTFDARCGDVPNFVCSTPGASSSQKDDPKESVCLRRCSGSNTPEVNAQICNAPVRVKLPDAQGRLRDIDAAAGTICVNQRAVTACNFDDAYVPR